jgi:DNA invertase Pin-like site-specific DNA recombinase
MQTQENNVTLYTKKEKFDSASQLGKHLLTILSAFDEVNGKTGMMERAGAPSERRRMPKELADLRVYMRLVKKGEMSVTEACQKLNIGRTTYYRRCRQLEDTVTEEVEGAEDDTV